MKFKIKINVKILSLNKFGKQIKFSRIFVSLTNKKYLINLNTEQFKLFSKKKKLFAKERNKMGNFVEKNSFGKVDSDCFLNSWYLRTTDVKDLKELVMNTNFNILQ